MWMRMGKVVDKKNKTSEVFETSEVFAF